MEKSKRCLGHFKPLLLGLLLLTAILYLTNFAIAQTSRPPPNPLLEKWILEQVAFGEEADLKRQFPDEKDRVLSAKFLERLLYTAS